MHVLLLNASPSPTSLHQILLDAVAGELTDVTFERISARNLEAPLWTPEREAVGVPEVIQGLAQAIASADVVVFASPEHNGGTPAMMKNAIDWLSRAGTSPFFPAKVVLLSTSPGARGGKTNLDSLAQRLPWWGATLLGAHSLGSFHSHFSAETGLPTDKDGQSWLSGVVAQIEDVRSSAANAA